MSRPLYDALGVDPGCSQDEVKQAWRELVRKLHPDRNPGDVAAAARFRAVRAAWDVLGDPTRRAMYDEFGEDGYLSDAWGGSKFRILSDRNNDGLIELQDAALSEILDALKETYDSDVVDAAKNKIRSIHADVAFYVLIEDEVPENVFSWDVEKYMK